MALRNITKDGNETLRKKCRMVDVFDSKLAKLLDDMKETMRQADGVGLAGPQVGILRRVAVIEIDDFYVELVNPIIVATDGEQIGSEACLSVPNKSCIVKRPYKVTVQYQDRNGDYYTLEGEELLARACCHEIDHLDGILFYDKEYKEAQ